MKKKICIIFSLFLICLLSIQGVYAQDVDLKDIEIEATLDRNGNAHIKEKWKIDVYEGTEIYKVFNNMGNSQLSGLKVSDEQGNHYQYIGEWDSDVDKEDKNNKCGLITDDDSYEICFGIGDYGSRVYTFEYDISHFVQQYQDTQGFNYAFFSEMELEPQHVKITLSSPHYFNKDNARIWAFGYDGKVYFQNGDVIMETSSVVPEGAKMQLLMKIDNDTFTRACPNDDNFQDILDDAIEGSEYEEDQYDQGDYYSSFVYSDSIFNEIAIIVFVVTFVLALCGLVVYLCIRFTHDYQFSDHMPLNKKDISMFRDIPCDKDIFLFYYYAKILQISGYDERTGLLSAILLRWIQKGYIEMKKEEVSHWILFKKDGYSIDLDKPIDVDHPLERKLLQFFKEASGDNLILETDEFEYWCQKNYHEIDQWFDDIDQYIENDLRKKGLLSLEVTYTKFMGFKIPKDTDTYDVSIREEFEHILGFKKFLEEMSLIDEKEVIEVKLWEEYLIFASILDMADKVKEQLGRLCPQFSEQSSIDPIYVMPMVHSFSHNSMAASAEAAGGGGSSSFGGGGGGFSGGGGGGVR